MRNKYKTKRDLLIKYCTDQHERAKQEMLDAACVTDINTVLMKAGEQTAFDFCISEIKRLYPIKDDSELLTNDQNPERSVATDDPKEQKVDKQNNPQTPAP